MTRSVSVAMCTYNGARYLPQQLDSILAQTRPPDEIVIVDDGSTDATFELLKEYQERHPLLRIYRNDVNLGPNGNFEKAASLTSGDLIFFSDQDDLWQPRKIELMLERLGPGDFLYSDAEIIDGEGRLLEASELAYFRVFPCPPHDPWYFLWNNCVSGHNLVVSRRLLDKSYPFPQYSMYDQWLAVLATFYSGADHLPLALCQHRIHQTNFANNLKLDREKRRRHKARGFLWRDRKSRIYQKFTFQSELIGRLVDLVPDTFAHKRQWLAIHDHFKKFDRCFFNLRLLYELLPIRDSILLNDSRRLKNKKLKRLCLGGRGYLFPIP